MKSLKLGIVYINRNKLIPLGPLYIASYLKMVTDVDVRILDINYDDILKETQNERFDIIGISSMTINYGEAIELASRLREAFPNTPILVGGVHISSLPESLPSCIDIGVIGEGEETLYDLVSHFQKHGNFKRQDIQHIKGICFREDENRLITTGSRSLLDPIDKIPTPNYDILSDRYFQRRALITWGGFGVESSLITGRGCPFTCKFCATTEFWRKKVRYHSTERVVRNVEDLIARGVTHIQIWDDLFTINKNRLKELAQVFRARGITEKVKFNCQPRANMIDDEWCEILKSLNVKIVLFGFESGSDRILKLLKDDRCSVEDNKNAIITCVRHGLKVQGSVIFGSPGEKLEDMYKTVDFLRFAHENGANRIWSFVMTPFPGTKMWQIALERGKVSNNMDWRLLSHQNISRPLLLDDDISVNEFEKVFMEGRKVLNSFKWQKVFSFLQDNFMSSVKEVISRPQYIMQLFSKIEP